MVIMFVGELYCCLTDYSGSFSFPPEPLLVKLLSNNALTWGNNVELINYQ